MRLIEHEGFCASNRALAGRRSAYVAADGGPPIAPRLASALHNVGSARSQPANAQIIQLALNYAFTDAAYVEGAGGTATPGAVDAERNVIQTLGATS